MSSSSRHLRLRRQAFLRDGDGGMSVLMIFLIPAFIMIFAAALDLSKLNSQRKYVQAQADLSALSAVQRLPDSPDARIVAGNVARRNPFYGRRDLEARDVVFGNFQPGVGLVPSADQAAERGIDAVGLTVVSRYAPILLAGFFADDELWVARRAVAARRDVASFTLRNALLRVDTSRSILDAVLGDRLNMNAALVSYEGLANTRISGDQLMNIAKAEAGADLLTFTEVLNADVSYSGFLGQLARAGMVPAAALIGAPSGTFRLGDVMQVAPQVAHLNWNRTLPDISVSAFDLLFAVANLSGQSGHHRLSVATGLTAAPLADPSLGLVLVDPGVTVHGLANAAEPLRAEVAQIRTTVSGTLAGLVSVELEAGAAVAEASLIELDCEARQPEDIVARLQVRTAPAEFQVNAGLLVSSLRASSDKVTVAGHTTEVSVRIADIGKPIEVQNPILVSAVTGALVQALQRLRNGQSTGGVGGGLLSGVTSVLGTTAAALDTLIANRPMLDGSAQALLDMLGIRVASAEVVFHGFGCSSALVE